MGQSGPLPPGLLPEGKGVVCVPVRVSWVGFRALRQVQGDLVKFQGDTAVLDDMVKTMDYMPARILYYWRQTQAASPTLP